MPSELPLGEPGHELLLREMGRINSELAAQRRHSAMTLHDLAAPAQVVLGLSETLLEHPGLDPFVRGRLEQLHRSAESLRGLLAELNRGFSLDDASQLSLQRLEVFDLVSSLVETLPKREQLIMKLRFYDGMTQSQIADRLGISQMHVSRLLARSLAQLRTRLEQEGLG